VLFNLRGDPPRRSTGEDVDLLVLTETRTEVGRIPNSAVTPRGARLCISGDFCLIVRAGREPILFSAPLFPISGAARAAENAKSTSGVSSFVSPSTTVLASESGDETRVVPVRHNASPQAASDSASAGASDISAVASFLEGASETAWSIAGKVAASLPVALCSELR